MSTEEDNITAEAWGMVDKLDANVTLEQMDDMVIAFRKVRDEYDEAKTVAAALYKEVERMENLIIQTLEANKRSNYSVDGVALVSVTHKESYKTPKTNEDKEQLFKYIALKYGADALQTMISINSQTLNAWANREAATGVMVIPGLELPTATPGLSMRRR